MKRVSSNYFFMTTIRRKRCPICGFLESVKNGKQRGHQRYYCKNCNSYYTSTRKDISLLNRFVWFERWILGKQTLKQLCKISGYSEKTLRVWFDAYLQNYPEWEISRRDKVNLMIDGTYFPNKVCLVLYRDFNIKATLLYRVTDNEWESEIREDLENLLKLGVEIESVTCDGGNNIIKSVKKTSKNIILQRCIIHIQRESKTWLTKHPKSDAGKFLRSLVSCLHEIKSYEDRDYWLYEFHLWEQVFRDYINQKSYSEDYKQGWYTHKMIRKSYVHIRRALPNMFHYLDNPKIPNNTNSLESFFGHLKQNISLHRGLSKIHYKNYVKWYLYFRNMDNKK